MQRCGCRAGLGPGFAAVLAVAGCAATPPAAPVVVQRTPAGAVVLAARKLAAAGLRQKVLLALDPNLAGANPPAGFELVVQMPDGALVACTAQEAGVARAGAAVTVAGGICAARGEVPVGGVAGVGAIR